MRHRFFGLLAGIALTTAGCNTTSTGAPPATSAAEAAAPGAPYVAPPLPDIEVGKRPPRHTDEAGLWLQVDRREKAAQTSGNRITDPILNRYVSDVACKLAGAYCPDIRVYVVRVPYFNASMAPNGMMTVWSGLLLRVQNEAQLAAVLGHEIGHYLRRHSVQQWRRMINTSGFLSVFSVGMAIIGIPAITDIAALAARGHLSSFSRDHEREADAIGIHRIAEAGYDPHQAATVWANLIKESEASGEESKFDVFLSTHPRTEERQQTLKSSARAILKTRPDAAEVGEDRFQQVLAPHRFTLLRDEIRLRAYKKSLALLDILASTGNRLGEIEYFRGEVHRIRDSDDENDREKALQSYRRALSYDHAPADVYRSLGLLHRRMNNPDEAADAFARFLELRPDAPDAEILKSYLQKIG